MEVETEVEIEVEMEVETEVETNDCADRQKVEIKRNMTSLYDEVHRYTKSEEVEMEWK